MNSEFEKNKKKIKENMENQSEKDYEKVREILIKNGKDKHNRPFIQRRLHEKENLRKTFLAVIKYNPARISEVSEESLLTKPTCYSQLHNLMDLQLVGRVFVMDVKNKVVNNEVVEKKFEEWTKNMPEQLKRYYLAKTSFWVITEFGKSFCQKAYEFNQEFKEKNIEKND